MVAQFVLGVGLAAVVALGPVNNRGDGPAGDALQEGVRLLEEDDRVGIAEHDLQAEAKRHVDATAALARAVATRPDDPTARAWYALALLKTFEKDDALRRADEAVRLGPQAAFAYRVRGLVHAGREEHEKAAADLNQAVRLGPRDAANLRARGQFFADRHESERALADYAAALKVDGRDAKAYWLRARLRMEAMNTDLAIKDFDAAIRARPDLPALRAARGLLRMLKQDHAGVVDDLGAALKERPDQEMFVLRGVALTHLDRHTEAIRDFDEAMRFGPDAKLFLARGVSYQKLGRLERALQDIDEAVKMKPEAESFAARGLLLKKMGRREKAADDMSEAIRREPGNTTFRTVRGDLLLELGREEAALADYDEAVRLDPDKAEPHFFRGVGRLIAGHRGSGDDFRAVLRLKGWRHEASPSCVLDGYAADLLAGRPAEARAFLEQALAKCDAAAWPYPLLRCLHGDVVEADALAAAPGDRERTEARLCLGIKRLSEGRRDAGLRDLREVCDGGDSSGFTIDIARAVLRREGGSPPAAPR
jgi:tetratricopeptide (TPR) repeat protein